MKLSFAKTILSALALLVLVQSASAQSNCKNAKGTVNEVFIGGDTSGGPLKNGGWLDGTVLFAYNIPGVYPTPDPNEITYAFSFSITGVNGVLKGKGVFLVDLASGQSASIVKIDPAASTGLFEGATGFLFVNTVKTTPGPPPSFYFIDLVGGQVCFAR